MATNGKPNISKDNTSKDNIIKYKSVEDNRRENEISDNSQILSSATADDQSEKKGTVSVPQIKTESLRVCPF